MKCLGVLLVATLSVSGGSSPSAARRVTSVFPSGAALPTFAGHWTFGFEQSSFVACGSAERWWLDTGQSTLPAPSDCASQKWGRRDV